MKTVFTAALAAFCVACAPIDADDDNERRRSEEGEGEGEGEDEEDEGTEEPRAHFVFIEAVLDEYNDGYANLTVQIGNVGDAEGRFQIDSLGRPRWNAMAYRQNLGAGEHTTMVIGVGDSDETCPLFLQISRMEDDFTTYTLDDETITVGGCT